MAITEKQFAQQVVELAEMFGWMVYRAWLSMHSPKGWPDLFMVRGERAVVLELKSGRGKATPEQEQCIEALGRVPGITARVVRPEDFEWIAEQLRRELSNG